MFFKNQRIGNKYQILDNIGTGGFGSVYLARDLMIDKQVAIKVPHKQGENQEKLFREPRLLAALNHPNIVGVITADLDNGVFYIVMEYVNGESMEQRLRREGPPPIDQALDWFEAICDALSYAHDKNVLHRDVRPANVLMSKEGHIKVADLGTSRILQDEPYAATRIGSPPYMSPEHFQGKATFQSDVYSTGILMYEVLTGKLPYYDKNPKTLAQIAREGKAPLVESFNPNVGKDLSRIVQRAMHPRLSTRYQRMRDLAVDVRQLRRRQVNTADSAELGHLVEAESREQRRMPIPREIPTKEISNLFCWNCSRPVQKRTRSCPNCGVALD